MPAQNFPFHDLTIHERYELLNAIAFSARLTLAERIAYMLIVRLSARSGQAPAPSARTLSRLTSMTSSSSGARLIDGLATKGAIVVDRVGGRRRKLTVVSSFLLTLLTDHAELANQIGDCQSTPAVTTEHGCSIQRTSDNQSANLVFDPANIAQPKVSEVFDPANICVPTNGHGASGSTRVYIRSTSKTGSRPSPKSTPHQVGEGAGGVHLWAEGEGACAPSPAPMAPPHPTGLTGSHGAQVNLPKPASPETPTPLPPAPGPAIVSGRMEMIRKPTDYVGGQMNGKGCEEQVLRGGLGEEQDAGMALARAAIATQKARRKARAAKVAENRDRRLEIGFVVGAYRLTIGEIEDRAKRHGTDPETVVRLATDIARTFERRGVRIEKPIPYFLAALDKELARGAVDGFRQPPKPGSLRPMAMWSDRQSTVDETRATRVGTDLRRPA